MDIKKNVQEQEINTTTLQVTHRHLKVPEQVYLQSVNHLDPWNEAAYQEFIQKYLDEINDGGIVGMVRVRRESPYVYFDAAIRYPHGE